MTRLIGMVFAGMLVVSWSGFARADVVMPPPDKCPDGHTPQTGHHGPYCQPPPPESCPEGHTPKVVRDKAYCEPPADPPCPPGSYWTSTSATDTWCQAGWNANDAGECGMGYKPVESSLCVRFVPAHRFGYEVVSKECASDADCTGKEESCKKANRCVPVPKPAPATPPTEKPTPAETATPDEAEATPDDTDEPAKGKCSMGAVDAGPDAAGTGALLALLALLGLRRVR